MIYPEFRDEIKAFPNFSAREIEKHFPGFDSRRLVEWQEKGYIQKLRNRYYYFSDQYIDEPFLYYTANQDLTMNIWKRRLLSQIRGR